MNLRTLGEMKKGTIYLTQTTKRISQKVKLPSPTLEGKRVEWPSSTQIFKT